MKNIKNDIQNVRGQFAVRCHSFSKAEVRRKLVIFLSQILPQEMRAYSGGNVDDAFAWTLEAIKNAVLRFPHGKEIALGNLEISVEEFATALAMAIFESPNRFRRAWEDTRWGFYCDPTSPKIGIYAEMTDGKYLLGESLKIIFHRISEEEVRGKLSLVFYKMFPEDMLGHPETAKDAYDEILYAIDHAVFRDLRGEECTLEYFGLKGSDFCLILAMLLFAQDEFETAWKETDEYICFGNFR